jgi:zinc/manganese transport system substrate-binding protein
MRSRFTVLVAGLVAVLAAACSSGGDRPGGSGGGGQAATLEVVATTTQVADFAKVVGGDRVRVTGLIKPNVDAHDYEPSPADLDAIARADVVLQNGVGLEEWLDDTIKSSGFQGPVVDTSQGVALRRDEGGEPDPHIWQDPRNAQLMATNVERALAQAAPGAAPQLEANLAAYQRELEALDAEVARQIGSLANKKLVTNHDAIGYYIDRYGLEFVGSIIPSADTSAELSGRDVRDLVAKIRQSKVKAIFSETSLPPRTAETIAREAGVKVVEGDDALYGDSLGPPGSDADTYVKMIRHNTATIVGALGGS